MRVIRQHGVALVGTDAICDGREQCLVVVASDHGGLLALDECALAASLASEADLERQRRLIAACPHSSTKYLTDAVPVDTDPTVRRVEAYGDARRLSAPQRGCSFFAIPVASACAALACAEATGVSSRAACRSSACRSIRGSSLPRFAARRSIPRHAFGLKEYLSGALSCKIEDSKYTFSSLCDAPTLRRVEDSPGKRITVAHDFSGGQPLAILRQRNICFRILDVDEAFKHLLEILPIVRGQGARHILPHSPSRVLSIRRIPHFLYNSHGLIKQAGARAFKTPAFPGDGEILAW